MDKQKIVLRFMDDGKLKRDCPGEMSLLDNFISIVDRRLHQRFTADVLDMLGKAAYTKIVRVIDINNNGIVLKTDRALDVGSPCILKMKGKGISLNVNTLVTRSSFDGNTKIFGNLVPVYKVGLKFTNISIDFVKNHKLTCDKQVNIFTVSNVRQHISLQIETPEKAILIGRKDFKIKNISLGGMLIESKNLFDIGERLFMKIIRSTNLSIRLSGKVVSCFLIKESNHTHYDVGIKFVNLSEKSKDVLKEAICLLENIGSKAV